MIFLNDILVILDRELNLQGVALAFTEKTRLAGSLPQLDSLAIVNVIAALEDRYSFEFPEEELDDAIFETVGALINYLNNRT